MSTKASITHKSIKHSIIDKANSNIVLSVALATFIVVFSLFAMKSLFSQGLYHGRVISEKEKALSQLESNKEQLGTLKLSYDAFVGEAVNILEGNPKGEGPRDGDNAKIVLDALPSTYDYPALSSSFEKILKDGGYDIKGIGGQEDQSLASITSVPGAVIVPYSFSFSSTTERTKELLEILESSIRPMNINILRIQLGEDILQTSVTLHTYFNPEKKFEIGSKEVQ